MHGLDMLVSVGAVVRYLGLDVRLELLPRLREHERMQRLVRLVVQPEVHRHVDLHDERGAERERRLLGRRDVSHHV